MDWKYAQVLVPETVAWRERLHDLRRLLLIVGEMDTNVDPSSTMQVVHRLIKHNKNFDLLVIPGANHSAGRGDRYAAYGDHKRYDFFVRHLLGVNPPPWNQPPAGNTTQSANK